MTTVQGDKERELQETISRLREAYAQMNVDYMQTKLKLEEMTAVQDNKPDLGSQLLKFSSKMKQLSMNKIGSDANSSNNNATMNNSVNTSFVLDENDRKALSTTTNNNKRIKSLQVEISKIQQKLKQCTEQNDQLRGERDALLINFNDAQTQISRLKCQSADDANSYEVLLDKFRNENESVIEHQVERLENEFEQKRKQLMDEMMEYQEKYEAMNRRWDENEESWANKFDLIVAERNSLKRKVKSLQHDLSENIQKNKNNNNNKSKTNQNSNTNSNESTIKNDNKFSKPNNISPIINGNGNGNTKQNNNNNNNNNNSNSSKSGSVVRYFLEDSDEGIGLELEKRQQKEILRLKQHIRELNHKFNNEKTVLLSSMQRMSSKHSVKNVASKGNDFQYLVNSLSILLAEKEDIITSLHTSKVVLGKRVLSLEQDIKQLLQQKR